MSNLIPPLLSSSPPPIVGPLDEDDDDEFGDFRAAADSYDCDDISLPASPKKSPEKELKPDLSSDNLDINFNKSQKVPSTTEMPSQNLNGSIVEEEVVKDFQDRRKSLDDEVGHLEPCEVEVNSSISQSLSPTIVFDTPNNQVLDEQIVQEDFIKIQKHSDALEDDFSVEHESDGNQVKDESVAEANPSNEENLFDGVSESNQEKTSNSDLSDCEIKTENDEPEEINSEITDNIKDTSSKGINYDNLSESSLSLRVCETDTKLSDDDFGDFANHFENEIADKPDEIFEEEFDDFVNPCSTSALEDQADDDFGDFESTDFADFSSHKPTFLEIDEKNAANKSETILKEIFPSGSNEVDECEISDETKGNPIFDELKDVTETNALIYQWSKSKSQKMFFKALNIDTRNILYGPAWNSSMPRFAANLGLTPLEPVRSEILTPTPVQNVSSPSSSSQKNNGDIPTAQFDWSGSGLINPLDSTSAGLPGSVPEDSSQQIATDLLPTPSHKPEPISNLFGTEILENIPTNPTPPSENEPNLELPKSLSNFSPFESPKLIPLRETHISTELNDNKPGWLQPTILTPDLPRKEPIIDPDDEDEFDDFQMVLPEDDKNKSNAVAFPDLSEFDTTSKVPTEQTSHNHEHIFGTPLNSGPINSFVQNETNDDDEFTEFHSSLPQPEILKPQPEVLKPQPEVLKPQPDILKPLQPVTLEPLKPTLQYSTLSTQINWPDPGVTDEDIKNIELSYSRKTETQDAVSKDNSLDEEEWTDFVSVTNPVKSVLPERTATPDLPLSVLNLNNVQAPKQPIPVITPSGLVQTKLSSNITKSVVQTTVQPNMYKPPATQFQPSIISNQFAANFFGNSAPSPTKSQPQDDDDDWSEFVSSQPPPQVNGYQQRKEKVPQINWSNATTNIIMNPTHFETLQNYATPQNKKVPTMPARNVIPSISAIPDLDFIAPKNRTSKK